MIYVNDNQKLLIIRIGYLAAIILDLLFAIEMILVSITGTSNFLSPIFSLGTFSGLYYRYAIAVAASTMFGWTALHCWAFPKPIERKGVFVLTVFPVMIILIYSNILAGSLGLISTGEMIFRTCFQSGITTLFIICYFIAKSLE